MIEQIISIFLIRDLTQDNFAYTSKGKMFVDADYTKKSLVELHISEIYDFIKSRNDSAIAYK